MYEDETMDRIVQVGARYWGASKAGGMCNRNPHVKLQLLHQRQHVAMPLLLHAGLCCGSSDNCQLAFISISFFSCTNASLCNVHVPCATLHAGIC